MSEENIDEILKLILCNNALFYTHTVHTEEEICMIPLYYIFVHV